MRLVCVLFALSFLLAGCGQDQYATERQYYWAQKHAEKIFRNPQATPPNQLQRVIKEFARFAEKHPRSNLGVDAEFTIARLYLAKEEFEKARQQLKKILDAYSQHPNTCSEAVFLMGNSYELQNNWDLALAQYRKIMESYPTTLRGIDIPLYIMQHYKAKLQPDKMREAARQAIEYYNGLAARYPRSPFAFRVRLLVGQCYMELKEWHNAIATFEDVIESFKDKTSMDGVMMDIATIYARELKDKEKAAEALQRLMKEYPKSRLGPIARNMLKNLKEAKE